jgi:hypothetical protein
MDVSFANRKKWLIFSLIALSLSSAAIEGLHYWFNPDEGTTTESLADLVTLILLALWIDADSRDHPQIARPYDYGFLVYVFWLPYLPYYLCRTRGPLGLLMFAGFLILMLLGSLVQLGIYMARAM